MLNAAVALSAKVIKIDKYCVPRILTTAGVDMMTGIKWDSSESDPNGAKLSPPQHEIYSGEFRIE